jgi:hypothetical protein
LNEKLNKVSVPSSEWVERYLLVISNLIWILLIEGQSFLDQDSLNRVLAVADHAQKFYELNKKSTVASKLEEHVTRCNSAKASALYLTGSFSPALELSMKVLKS